MPYSLVDIHLLQRRILFPSSRFRSNLSVEKGRTNIDRRSTEQLNWSNEKSDEIEC
jgi:hypothetical protein